MRMYDIILKKRRGEELSPEEIKFAIDGFTSGEIPDYQMSALAMAICFNSMTDAETAALTYAMADSGDKVELSMFGDATVDKHSTGGVGDKTTLIIAPIVAACGAKLAKMSGRGLGHTGGTIDKLESIPGYRTELSEQDFIDQVSKIGVCVISQTGNMVPADKKLYALRDVTATVDSVPLIASSVMSKKLAAGAKSIVLDVKVGSGAFMHDLKSAEELAKKMVSIGKHCGRNVRALITNMDVPLGRCVGNTLEVVEAISVLKNETFGELREICLELSAAILSMSMDLPHDKAYAKAEIALTSGAAYKKFKEWISAQGADEGYADDTSLFRRANFNMVVSSPCDGYISKMNTERIGSVACMLGAGRASKDDSINYAAGIVIDKKVGDEVCKGEELATLCSDNEEILGMACKEYISALEFSETAPQKPQLILEKVE